MLPYGPDLKKTMVWSRSLPEQNAIWQSPKQSVSVGINGQSTFTVGILIQSCTDVVGKGKALLLCNTCGDKKKNHSLTMTTVSIIKQELLH